MVSWDAARLLMTEEELSREALGFHWEMNMHDYQSLCDTYGHERVKSILGVVASSLPKHRWSTSKDSAKASVARSSNSHKIRKKWRSGIWDFWKYSRSIKSSENQYLLWFISVSAEAEGFDGMKSVDNIVSAWGADKAVEFARRSETIASLIGFVESELDSELVDVILT